MHTHNLTLAGPCSRHAWEEVCQEVLHLCKQEERWAKGELLRLQEVDSLLWSTTTSGWPRSGATTSLLYEEVERAQENKRREISNCEQLLRDIERLGYKAWHLEGTLLTVLHHWNPETRTYYPEPTWTMCIKLHTAGRGKDVTQHLRLGLQFHRVAYLYLVKATPAHDGYNDYCEFNAASTGWGPLVAANTPLSSTLENRSRINTWQQQLERVGEFYVTEM